MKKCVTLVVAMMMATAGGAAALVGGAMAPAGASTFSVTSPYMCGGDGSFQKALADANANPGTDTIEFASGLQVQAWTCNTLLPGPIQGFPFTATESVTIVGNGATMVGGQVMVGPGGRVNDPNSCPQRSAGVNVASKSVGFLEIGTFNVDNSAVSVSVDDLNFSGMPTLFLVEKNATLSLRDSKAEQTMSFNYDCSRPPIQSTEGNVNLTRVTFTDSSAPTNNLTEGGGSVAVVAGYAAGALTMDRVTMEFNTAGRAIYWHGSSAKIVSSEFFESGGIYLDVPRSDIVNSVLRTTRQHVVDRITSVNGMVRTEASTFVWSFPACDRCGTPGFGFEAGGGGLFDFHTTAIGSGATFSGAQPLLGGNTDQYFSDALTWVQPTGSQDAAAIATILPTALTDAPGLPTDPFGGYPATVTPLLGTPGAPGVLIDAVENASCDAPDDTNKLINPIDSTCISTDVFGKPRWDSGNDARNIGAIQSVESPHLTVAAVDTDVALSWNRPADPSSGPITGYRVTYLPAAGGTPQTVDVSGADTTGTTITGLTPGVPYVFDVAALNTDGAGPASNTVTATPFGPVQAPEPGATGGTGQVQLFWTEPDRGGHPGPLTYLVVHRPLGTTTWLDGPGYLSGRITEIGGLDAGTTYEFGVVAVATDGTTSDVGATTATTLPAPPDGGGGDTPPDEVVPSFTG